MNLVRVNVHYSGRVQGVGFRYIVKSLVPGYEVLGTVKNLPDGRVEMVAEGQQVELEDFLQAIRDSGLRRNIQDEELVWGEACLLYTSPRPRDATLSRMPSSA